MMDISVERSTPVIDMLDHFQATITILMPMDTLRSALAAFTAFTVLYLMQANTRHAGFGNPVRVVRLVQRISMAVLAMVLALVAALPYIGVGDQFHDLITVMLSAPLLVMVLCSIVIGRLVTDPEHRNASRIDKVHVDR